MSDPPAVRRVETATGHHYVDSVGNRVPGSTTVLKNLPKGALETWKISEAVKVALDPDKHPKKKPLQGAALVNWCAEAGDRQARKAAGLGNVAHAFAEAWLKGEDPDYAALPDGVKGMADCFLQFVEDFKPEPVLVEGFVTCLNPKTGKPEYCGTADLFARVPMFDGALTVIDWKGATKMPRPSHALQLCSYARASHYVDPESGLLRELQRASRAIVVLLNGGNAGRGYRAYECDISEPVWLTFKSLLRIYRFVDLQDLSIIGEIAIQ